MTKNKLLELLEKEQTQELTHKDIVKLRSYNDESIDIILNSKYKNIMIEIISNQEFKSLPQNTQNEIINILNNSESEEKALAIYYVVRSGLILSSGLTLEIIKIITNTNSSIASYIVNTAINPSVLINSNIIEILKIISKSKEEYQASSASDIAKDLNVIVSEKILELIKIASETIGEEKSRLVNNIAKNKDILISDLSIELTTLASKTNLSESINLINEIASNKILEKNRLSKYYLIDMLFAKSNEEVEEIYKQAQIKITTLKKQESTIKKDTSLFWNVYKKNPQEAILSLIDINSEQEITEYTRIRTNKK